MIRIELRCARCHRLNGIVEDGIVTGSAVLRIRCKKCGADNSLTITRGPERPDTQSAQRAEPLQEPSHVT